MGRKGPLGTAGGGALPPLARLPGLEQPASPSINLKHYVMAGKGPEAGRPGDGGVPAVVAGATGSVH